MQSQRQFDSRSDSFNYIAHRERHTHGRNRGGRRAAFVALVLAFGCIVLSNKAQASCGASKTPKIPIVLPKSQLFQAPGMLQSSPSKPKGVGNATIVGLWHVKFVSNGELYDEGFDQFHSDGTEILNDDGVPPAEGNVCLGVFRQVGGRTYRLKHPAFVWDGSGNLVGTLVIRETITIDRYRNSYKGSFEFDFYDLSGNLTDKVTGDLIGERIVAD